MSSLSKSDVKKMANPQNGPIGVESNGVSYSITKTYLTPQEQYDFVHEVVASTMVEGEPSYALFEFAVRYCEIKYFTNIPMPKDLSLVNVLAFNTMICDDIESYCRVFFLRKAAFNELHDLKEKKENPLNELVDVVSKFLENMSGKIDLKQVDSMIDVLGGLDPNKIVKEAAKAKEKTEDVADLKTETVEGEPAEAIDVEVWTNPDIDEDK